MLKISTSIMTLPFILKVMTTTSWPISISALFSISFISMIFLPSQLLTPSSMTHIMFLDQLSAPMVSLSIWISALMLLASYKELINKNNPKSLLLYIIILLISLLLAFSSSNMMMFYIFFETSLIPTMLLILGWGYQPERLQATTYLILYTLTASLPLLTSLMLMYSSPTNLSTYKMSWDLMTPLNNLSILWWMITILAFMTKMPLYTLHLWLPKAHVEAPVAGSMILAGILLKLGSYGLMRLSSLMTTMNTLIANPMMSLSLWGAVLTSMICLRQTDMKSLIAYSSVGHMSLLMAGLMSNSSWGWNAALTMMLAHGLCSSCLFALANMSYETTNTRSIFLSKGIITIFPTMTMWWFLACAMNMAAPPTPNLLSEMFLTMSTISFSMWSMLLLPLLIFLGAAYSLLLYSSTQHGPSSSFSLPTNLYTQRNHTTLMLHLLPATIMITKPDTIMIWL